MIQEYSKKYILLFTLLLSLKFSVVEGIRYFFLLSRKDIGFILTSLLTFIFTIVITYMFLLYVRGQSLSKIRNIKLKNWLIIICVYIIFNIIVSQLTLLAYQLSFLTITSYSAIIYSLLIGIIGFVSGVIHIFITLAIFDETFLLEAKQNNDSHRLSYRFNIFNLFRNACILLVKQFSMLFIGTLPTVVITLAFAIYENRYGAIDIRLAMDSLANIYVYMKIIFLALTSVIFYAQVTHIYQKHKVVLYHE